MSHRESLAGNIRHEDVNQDLQLLILRETLEAIVGFSNVYTIDSKDLPEWTV